ncbi:MAG: rod shape-determining protein MreD [Lachnospiraceae bacterium]|nr:rod shape-determining protein MreD [Lachnospiraceae bacterium]
MIRKLITFIIIYFSFILQCSVFNHISLGGIVPNILIIVTATFGFMRGQNTGMAVGFISGLMADVFFGSPFGFITLLYTVIGYLNGFFKNIFYPEDIKLPMVLITGSELVFCVLYYVLKFLLRGRLNIGYYFVHIMLPEIVYTVVATLPLYGLIVWINEKLELYERRNS